MSKVSLCYQLIYLFVVATAEFDSQGSAGLINAFADLYNADSVDLVWYGGVSRQYAIEVQMDLDSFSSINGFMEGKGIILYVGFDKYALAPNFFLKHPSQDMALLFTKDSDIEETLDFLKWSTFDLTSEFYLVAENGTIFEVYKIHSGDSDLQILPFANWKDGKLKLATEAGKWERRRDLKGHKFKIAVQPGYPYIELAEDAVTGEHSMKGIFADIFFSLQELLNFEYEFNILNDDDSFGTLKEDGTFTGLIGQLQTYQIDIAPAGLTVTQERQEAVDFSIPCAHMVHKFFLKAPDTRQLNWTAFTDPFHENTWFILLGLSGAFVVITFLLVRHELAEDESHSKKNIMVFNSLLSSVTNVMVTRRHRPCCEVQPKSFLTRICIIIMIVVQTIAYSHWEGMLTSFLASEPSSLPFESLEELMENTNYRILVWPGTSYVDSFRTSSNQLWLSAYEKRIKPFIHSYQGERNEMLKSLVIQEGYTLYDNYEAIRMTPEYQNCEITAVPRAYEPKDFAFAFTKDSPYLPLMNHYIHQLHEHGQIKQLQDKYYSLVSEPECAGDGEEHVEPLSMNTCCGAFMLLAAGMVVALLFTMAKKIVELCKRARDKKRRGSKIGLINVSPAQTEASEDNDSVVDCERETMIQHISDLEMRIEYLEEEKKVLKSKLWFAIWTTKSAGDKGSHAIKDRRDSNQF